MTVNTSSPLKTDINKIKMIWYIRKDLYKSTIILIIGSNVKNILVLLLILDIGYYHKS